MDMLQEVFLSEVDRLELENKQLKKVNATLRRMTVDGAKSEGKLLEQLAEAKKEIETLRLDNTYLQQRLQMEVEKKNENGS